MRPLLLDTCAVLWLADGELARFAPETVQALREAEILYMSPVSEWEIAWKWANGGIELPVPPREMTARFVKRLGVKLIPFSEEVAFRAAELPRHHRDPADRFIIATALIGNLPVVTADRRFAQYGVEVLKCA